MEGSLNDVNTWPGEWRKMIRDEKKQRKKSAILVYLGLNKHEMNKNSAKKSATNSRSAVFSHFWLIKIMISCNFQDKIVANYDEKNFMETVKISI